MRRRTLQLTLTATLLLVQCSAWADLDQRKQSADQFPSDVAWTWFEALYNVVKAEQTTPPAASRIYGITAVALYESIVAGTEKNRSLVGQLHGLTSLPQPKQNKKYHWPTVANAVLASTIRSLYETISQASLETINSLEHSFASQQQAVVPGPEYARSVAHGQAVATAILAWAATDGYSIYNNCPYVLMWEPSAWEPTPPLFNPNPSQPCWGLVRPIVLTSGEECAPPGHPTFSTDPASDFYAAGLEVYNVGLGLTAEQKTIADYWSDGAGATGTPPGHWIAIVSQLARNDDLSLAKAADAYARVGIAVHDAFIACWYAKYVYNLQRPVTYIHATIDAADVAWSPYLVTPGSRATPLGIRPSRARRRASSPICSGARASRTRRTPITASCQRRRHARSSPSMTLRLRRPSQGSMAASTSRSTTTTGWPPGNASDRRSLTVCASRTTRTRATHNSRLQGGIGANGGRPAPVSMAGGNRAADQKSALARHGRLATRVLGFRHRNRRPCAVPEGVASAAVGFAAGHYPLSHWATARVHHGGWSQSPIPSHWARVKTHEPERRWCPVVARAVGCCFQVYCHSLDHCTGEKETMMMRTRRSMSVGFLLMILGVGLWLPLPTVTADDGCKSPMKTSLTDLGPGVEGKATLCVDAKGVSGKMKAEHLQPGDAYTVWFIYFDDPSQCVGGGPGVCGGADFGGDNPLGVFGRFDSAVGSDNGKVDFEGRVRGLQLSSSSQVQFVMFGHGPADVTDGRHLARQLLTPEDPAAGAPHLGNIVDGPGFTPTAIAVFNIP